MPEPIVGPVNIMRRMWRLYIPCRDTARASCVGCRRQDDQETFGSGGRTRTYFLLVPEAAKTARSPPLLVLLHGSGRDGKSLVEKREPLAKKEGIIVGPRKATSFRSGETARPRPSNTHAGAPLDQRARDDRRNFLDRDFGWLAPRVHTADRRRR